jgi:hypothetical protein
VSEQAMPDFSAVLRALREEARSFAQCVNCLGPIPNTESASVLGSGPESLIMKTLADATCKNAANKALAILRRAWSRRSPAAETDGDRQFQAMCYDGDDRVD